jgi:hypothetical protein
MREQGEPGPAIFAPVPAALDVHAPRLALWAIYVLTEQDPADVFPDLSLAWYLIVCVHDVHILKYMGQLVYITRFISIDSNARYDMINKTFQCAWRGEVF